MKQKKNEVQAIADAIVPESYKKAKYFAVMMFWQNRDRGIPEEVADPNDWENTVTVNFENGGIKRFLPKYQYKNLEIIKD